MTVANDADPKGSTTQGSARLSESTGSAAAPSARRTGGISGQASVLAPLLQTRSADDARTLCERLSSALVSTSTRVIDVFHEWDYDDDGVINHADFAAAMKQLGLDADVEGTAQLFETLDREQLGVITFENLRRGLRPPPGASRPRKVGTRARAGAGEGARKGGGCDGGGGGGGGGGEGAPLVPVAAQKPDPLTQSLLDTMKNDNADQVLRGVLLLNATKLAHVLKAMNPENNTKTISKQELLAALSALGLQALCGATERLIEQMGRVESTSVRELISYIRFGARPAPHGVKFNRSKVDVRRENEHLLRAYDEIGNQHTIGRRGGHKDATHAEQHRAHRKAEWDLRAVSDPFGPQGFAAALQGSAGGRRTPPATAPSAPTRTLPSIRSSAEISRDRNSLVKSASAAPARSRVARRDKKSGVVKKEGAGVDGGDAGHDGVQTEKVLNAEGGGDGGDDDAEDSSFFLTGLDFSEEREAAAAVAASAVAAASAAVALEQSGARQPSSVSLVSSRSLPALSGLGRQVRSEFTTEKQWSFPKAKRFGALPGGNKSPFAAPGRYDSVSAVGSQPSSQMRTAGRATFAPPPQQQRKSQGESGGDGGLASALSVNGGGSCAAEGSSVRVGAAAATACVSSRSRMSAPISVCAALREAPAREQVVEALSRNAARVVSLFHERDTADTGAIDKVEFRRGVAALGLTISDADADALFDSWDLDRSGTLPLTELRRILRRGGKPPPRPRVRVGAIGQADIAPPRDDAGDAVHDKLFKLLSSNASRVIDVFRQWDLDRDNTISRGEFRYVLVQIGICADGDEIDALFDSWDPENKRFITLANLRRNLKGRGARQRVSARNLGVAPAPQQEEKPVVEQLRESLAANTLRAVDLFREWDVDGNGSISRDEFRRALPLLGLEAETHEADELFRELDCNHSGKLEYAEFDLMIRRRRKVHQSESIVNWRPPSAGRSGTAEAPVPLSPAQAQLRLFISKHIPRLVDVVREWDDTGTGFVAKRDFRRAVTVLSSDFHKEEIDILFDEMDGRSAGSLKIPHLRKLLAHALSAIPVEDSAQQRQKHDNKISLKQLREALISKADKKSTAFPEWKLDANAGISKSDFRQALQKVGVHARDEDADRLFDEVDADHNGEMTQAELVERLKVIVHKTPKWEQPKPVKVASQPPAAKIASIDSLRQQLQAELAKHACNF